MSRSIKKIATVQVAENFFKTKNAPHRKVRHLAKQRLANGEYFILPTFKEQADQWSALYVKGDDPRWVVSPRVIRK
jgi:hypothetical protein